MRKRFCTLTFILLLAFSGAAGQSIIEERPTAAKDVYHANNITGILGAFPEEIKLLLSQTTDKRESVIQQVTYISGTLKGKPVVIAYTGIGKVNAALATILLIEHYRPKAILFTGIAGAINPDLAPGDIVIGTRLAHHDYGTLTPEGTLRRATRDPATLLENPIYFPSDSSLLERVMRAGKSVLLENVSGLVTRKPSLTAGVIVTGDVFVASGDAANELRKKMNAEATEMEGAAVAQVAYQQQVPFLVIRSMSDNAGNNASGDIINFYQAAARNSAKLVMAFLEVKSQQ